MRKRRPQRYIARLPVSIAYENRQLEAVSRNISLTGMFVETVAAIPFDAELRISIRIPSLEDPITTTAKVRWTDPGNGIGLHFGALRPHQVWALHALIARLNGRPGGNDDEHDRNSQA